MKLNLALAYNRSDVAKSQIFTDDWRPFDFDEQMMEAIKKNRAEFVELFLDNGLDLATFLPQNPPTKILNLYKYSIPPGRPGHNQLSKKLKWDLEHVGTFIESLMGEYYKHEYKTLKNNQQTEPAVDRSWAFRQLFKWAVLRGHHNLSLCLWQRGSVKQEATAAALFAGQICTAMGELRGVNEEQKKELTKSARDFEDRAIAVIKECYSTDEARTHELLETIRPSWGGVDCLTIARNAKNKAFVSQTACQSYLRDQWKGQLRENSHLDILACMLILPLVVFWLKFKDDSVPCGLGCIACPTPLRKLHIYFNTPIIKFAYYVVWYFLFLFLYAYVILVKLSPTFDWLEAVLIGWVITMFVEELRQLKSAYQGGSGRAFFRSYYIEDQWNILDSSAIVTFIIGYVLRACNQYSAARVVLSCNFILFCLRVLHIFSVNRQLGPKVVMITYMVWDLLLFSVILLVFVMSFAIASEAILYPNATMDLELFFNFPRKAYWIIFGELNLDEMEGGQYWHKNVINGKSQYMELAQCTDDPVFYENKTLPRCPSEESKYTVPLLIGVYIMLTNVLLLNLLIAMFSYTFNQIHSDTDQHWCFQRLCLVYEFQDRPALPPPFILLSHVMLFVEWCYLNRRCCSVEGTNENDRQENNGQGDNRKGNTSNTEEILAWESEMVSNYINNETDKDDDMINTALERRIMEGLMRKLQNMHHLPSHLTESTA